MEQTHEYEVVNRHAYSTLYVGLNNMAKEGWRLVCVVNDEKLIFERPFEETQPEDSSQKLIPVSAGRNSKGELIVLYKDSNGLAHIKLPDNSVWTLSPDSSIERIRDGYSCLVRIKSPEWDGIFEENRVDLQNAKSI